MGTEDSNTTNNLEIEYRKLREQLTDADNEIKGLVAKEIDLIAQIKRLDLAHDQRDDLLKALRHVVALANPVCNLDPKSVVLEARAAIAKAEGVSHKS